MDRRTFLAAASTGLLAGCIAPGGPADDGATTGETPPDTPTDRPSESPTDATTPTGSPDPTRTDPASRFRGVACPAFGDHDRTVCWHASGGADIYLRPSVERFQPVRGNDAVETISFTLHNETDSEFSLNPYAWVVHRRADEGWVRVAPEHYIEPLVEVPPGTTFEWVLSTRTHPTPNADETVYPVVDLSNGRHAFTVHGRLADGDDTSVACTALFDVQNVHVSASETTR